MSSAPSTVQPGTPPEGLSYLDDFYVPAFRILLKGKSQPSVQKDIQSVSFRDSLTDVDSIDLVERAGNWRIYLVRYTLPDSEPTSARVAVCRIEPR